MSKQATRKRSQPASQRAISSSYPTSVISVNLSWVVTIAYAATTKALLLNNPFFGKYRHFTLMLQLKPSSCLSVNGPPTKEIGWCDKADRGGGGRGGPLMVLRGGVDGMVGSGELIIEPRVDGMGVSERLLLRRFMLEKEERSGGGVIGPPAVMMEERVPDGESVGGASTPNISFD